MKRATAQVFIATALAGMIGGCASAPPDSGFGEVQKSVEQRSAAQIRWRQATPEDKAADEAITRLLQSELTADDAAQVALLNNLKLQATFQELGVARADLVQAGLLKNPTLSAERRLRGQAFEIDISQDILDVFLIPLRKRVAESQFKAAKLRVTDEVMRIWFDAHAASYELQAAKQLLELRRSIADATEASAYAAERLHEAGNLKDLDYANECALYDQAKIDLADAETQVLDRQEHLSALMGLWGPAAERWTSARRLPEPPDSEVSPVGLESLAVSRRSDLAAARQDVQTLARSYGLTQSTALFSEANLFGHLEGEPDGRVTAGPGIGVSVPIFDQGQAAIQRSQSQLEQVQQRYAALAVEIRSQVRSARNRLFAARSKAIYYRHIVLPLRHQIVEQTQLQYNAMQVGIFQLLQARQNEIDAGRAYVDALKDYWIARNELERAVGGRLGAGGASTQPASIEAPPLPQFHHGA